MNAQNQQLQQNAWTQQLLGIIDTCNLPPAQRNLFKNAISANHINHSLAFHFAEQDNQELLSPLSEIGSTIGLNFSNLNQMVNLGPSMPTPLGDVWALQIGPFGNLLRLGQDMTMQRIPDETLPVYIRVRGITNCISQITSVRGGAVACIPGACEVSRNQCIWLKIPLNGPDEPVVYGAIIACTSHAPSFQKGGMLNIPEGSEIYIC